MTGPEPVAVAADHNGVALKREIVDWLTARGHPVHDCGVDRDDQVVDYPSLCAAVGRAVTTGAARFGLVIGGSGSGETIACNKIRGIRATLCHTRFVTEIARAHNDANVMVIGAKVVSPADARELLGVWLSTPFKGGRHQDRVDQIARLERGEGLDPRS
ncbi:MAG TPA: RpiB/LacA/LacB family sugar-phosphate isomerase [Acidimicrobiales bacterium]|nr:RpiB/LacA/LacB family sugar-phosphate isomerase [Acidimicrobiales bacterium]